MASSPTYRNVPDPDDLRYFLQIDNSTGEYLRDSDGNLIKIRNYRYSDTTPPVDLLAPVFLNNSYNDIPETEASPSYPVPDMTPFAKKYITSLRWLVFIRWILTVKRSLFDDPNLFLNKDDKTLELLKEFNNNSQWATFYKLNRSYPLTTDSVREIQRYNQITDPNVIVDGFIGTQTLQLLYPQPLFSYPIPVKGPRKDYYITPFDFRERDVVSSEELIRLVNSGPGAYEGYWGPSDQRRNEKYVYPYPFEVNKIDNDKLPVRYPSPTIINQFGLPPNTRYVTKANLSDTYLNFYALSDSEILDRYNDFPISKYTILKSSDEIRRTTLIPPGIEINPRTRQPYTLDDLAEKNLRSGGIPIQYNTLHPAIFGDEYFIWTDSLSDSEYAQGGYLYANRTTKSDPIYNRKKTKDNPTGWINSSSALLITTAVPYNRTLHPPERISTTFISTEIIADSRQLDLRQLFINAYRRFLTPDEVNELTRINIDRIVLLQLEPEP